MGIKKETKVRDLDIIKPGNNFLALIKRSLDEIFTLKTYQDPLPRRWILVPVREQVSEVGRGKAPAITKDSLTLFRALANGFDNSTVPYDYEKGRETMDERYGHHWVQREQTPSTAWNFGPSRRRSSCRTETI